jgi:hypothetical protein
LGLAISLVLFPRKEASVKPTDTTFNIAAMLATLPVKLRPELIVRAASTEGVHAWPSGAAFLLIFPSARFSNDVAPDLYDRPHFFCRDGWPCGLPSRLRTRLATDVKLGLLGHPRRWERFSEAFWASLEQDPGALLRLDALVDAELSLLDRVEAPDPDV